MYATIQMPSHAPMLTLNAVPNSYLVSSMSSPVKAPVGISQSTMASKASSAPASRAIFMVFRNKSLVVSWILFPIFEPRFLP